MSRKSMIKPYKHCKKCGALIVSGELCEDCKPMTNADRIRQMTDEELAYLLQGQCICCAYKSTGCMEKVCSDGTYEWLKQEVSEDETERTD